MPIKRGGHVIIDSLVFAVHGSSKILAGLRGVVVSLVMAVSSLAIKQSTDVEDAVNGLA